MFHSKGIFEFQKKRKVSLKMFPEMFDDDVS